MHIIFSTINPVKLAGLISLFILMFELKHALISCPAQEYVGGDSKTPTVIFTMVMTETFLRSVLRHFARALCHPKIF